MCSSPLHPPGRPTSPPWAAVCQSGTSVEVEVLGNEHMPCASTLARSSEPGDGTRRLPPASEAVLLGELTLPSSRTGWLTNACYRGPLLQQTPAWILLSASGGCPVSSSPTNPSLCHHSPLFPRSLPSGGHPSSPRMALSARSPRTPVPSAGLSVNPLFPRPAALKQAALTASPWETGLPDAPVPPPLLGYSPPHL